MRIGLFLSYLGDKENDTFEVLKHEFARNKNVQLEESACLCEYDETETRLPEIAIIHPAPMNYFGCHDSIRDIIDRHPEVMFYVLALFGVERM